jgi:hypothetical protein
LLRTIPNSIGSDVFGVCWRMRRVSRARARRRRPRWGRHRPAAPAPLGEDIAERRSRGSCAQAELFPRADWFCLLRTIPNSIGSDVFGVCWRMRRTGDLDGIDGHQADLSSRKPGRDRAVSTRIEDVANAAAVDQHSSPDDQPSILEQAQLSGHGGAAQREAASKLGRLLGRNRQHGDDLSSRRIREEGDASPVPMRH